MEGGIKATVLSKKQRKEEKKKKEELRNNICLSQCDTQLKPSGQQY